MELLKLFVWLWDLVACPLYDGAIARLGHDRYWIRERASVVLSSPFAYPALQRAIVSHPDTEVRHRSERLLRPLVNREDDLRCLWLLVGPMPEAKAFAADESIRYRLAWWCDRLDVGWYSYRNNLRPENDPGAFECWMCDKMPWGSASTALTMIRGSLRGETPPDDDPDRQ